MAYRIAICPNAFRGSLTALDAAKTIADGLHQSPLHCSTFLLPLADGGDGTLDVWETVTGAERVACEVSGPRGELLTTYYARKGDTALVEMARASGIELLTQRERNPLYTTTAGTGQLIAHAVAHGAKHILVGVGGSATVDGGAGALHALGVVFRDAEGADVVPRGGNLDLIASVDLSGLKIDTAHVQLDVLCDVENPLLGPNGAAPVFGPQKGADDAMVLHLEQNLAHFADVLQAETGRRVHDMPRGGAAGGLCAGLVAGLDAKALSGARYLLDAAGYRELLQTEAIDLIITGEGKLDSQTIDGKAIQLIAQTAHELGIPVVALVGALALSPAVFPHLPIQAAYSIVQQPCTLDDALQYARPWLHNTAASLGGLLALKDL